ncbi:VWA domain-containing protein, partial [Aliarcobacter butzleri]|uniref:vWA domain-containing protein n=2 Tax=Aliarcobacter butzleri TaxID=28197 RepID=UPI00263CF63B
FGLSISNAQNATLGTSSATAVINDEDDNNPDTPDVTTDGDKPIIKIIGSEVKELIVDKATGDKVVGTVEIIIENGKVFAEDINITLSNGKVVTIKAGETTTGPINVETSRVDDAYKQDTTTETISIINTSNSSIDVTNKEATITITDDEDPTTVTITAAKVTDKVITKDNFENNQGFTVKAKDPYGKDAKISTHTGPAGFGVESLDETNSGKLGQTDQVYSGHTSEIGVVVKDGSTYKSESIEVEFKNPVHTLDVAFAWRHNGETAKVDFYNGNEKVGYAIVSGGGSNTDAIIRYYDKNGNLKDTVNAQGGTDNVDLVYTFKPAGDVTFTKAVFSADGAGSDYLIHSISYKEVSEGDSTTIVGSDEVAFKISTSNIPDPSKYDFINTFPTADVKIVDKNTGEDLFNGTVNLDKDGKAIVTVRTDGTTDLTATVSDVQGNFEKVDYSSASTTIVSSLSPQAGNDSITILEDTSYTLKSTDFGDNNQNVAKIKFTELPENGKIYVLKSEYTGSINDRAEYTSSENKIYVEIKVSDIVDISQINKGNVIFVPNKDTDDDGNFKFSVSNGNGNFSGNYTTDIIVKAVADAPITSINVTKVENSDNTSNIKPNIIINENNSINNIGTDNNDIIEVNKSLKMNDTINLKDGNDTLVLNNGGEQFNINGSNGDKIIHLNGELKGSMNINLGSGNDKIYLNTELKQYVYLNVNGSGANDTLYLKGNKEDYQLENFTNNSGLLAGKFITKEGGVLVFNNMESISFDNGYLGKEPESNTNIPNINEYKVDIYAALKDIDESETLSVVIKNIPTGAKLYDISGKEILPINGEYKVNVPVGVTSISDKLTLKVPQSYKGDINLQIEAKATEIRDNEDGQNFKVTTASDATVTTVDETSNITVNKGEKTNLVLTVDISGSMAVYGDGAIIDKEKGITRLDVVKQSLISTVETYKAAGNTMVNITLFANKALNKGWMSADKAIEYIKSLSIDKNFNIYEGKTKISDLSANSTDYAKALEITGKVNISGSGQADAKTVGYFISDGQPQTSSQQKAVDSDSDTAIVNWKTFINKNNIDLKVIGVGTAENNADALKYLKSVQVMSHDEVIVINEPSSIETIMLSTVEGTVFGDVTDNFSGGDGKVTIDSIEVGDQIYTKDTMPIGGIKLDGEGKLLFDFTTGKYAYNGNGIDIKEDATKSFKVNVSDEDGDKDSINVNFELNKDQIKDGIINFNEDGDINFSNLKNITEINLDNGEENKLSLTLKDVLDIGKKDGDGKINLTILGDDKDTVSFKDTVKEDGSKNAWSKTEGTGTDKGYDIYINSGDPTVQVKVEHPISDGITH